MYVVSFRSSHSVAKRTTLDLEVLKRPCMGQDCPGTEKETSYSVPEDDAVLLKGQIDMQSVEQLSGWICVMDVPYDLVMLRVSINNRHVGFVVPAEPRPDVVGYHYPECNRNNNPGFKISFAPETLGVPFKLDVVVVNNDGTRIYPFPGKKSNELILKEHGPKPYDWPLLIKRHRALPIKISNTQPVRLNILMCGFGYDLTGGPLSILRFAVLAARSGINVRWINMDGAGVSIDKLKAHMIRYHGLEDFDELVEFIFDGYSHENILTNPKDIFMATIYWTAYPAAATQALLDHPNILYFIQDFEPIFFERNSQWLEATYSYKFPHFPIFSTSFLEDYFAFSHIGIYAHCKDPNDCLPYTYSSQPAIRAAPSELFVPKKTHKKRFFAYARPHAARNAFDTTVAVISESVRLNVFDPLEDWEFIGLGSNVDVSNQCNLGGYANVCLKMMRNIPEPDYFALLQTGEVALSLMLSPHPSLPPFDFASAGLVTVTNSMETKTSFAHISSNIIVVEPELHALVEGLREAVHRASVQPHSERLKPLKWATSWDDDRCYGPTLMNKVKDWMKLEDNVFTKVLDQ